MIDEKLSVLLDQLLEMSVNFLKENGYDNVDYLHFFATGLEDAIKYGKDCPSIDNSLVVLDKNHKKIAEYL